MDKQGFDKIQRKYAASGLSRLAFCEQEGIPYSSYNYWLRKFQSADEVPMASSPVFTEIELTPGESPSRMIRIRYGSEVVIDIPLP